MHDGAAVAAVGERECAGVRLVGGVRDAVRAQVAAPIVPLDVDAGLSDAARRRAGAAAGLVGVVPHPEVGRAPRNVTLRDLAAILGVEVAALREDDPAAQRGPGRRLDERHVGVVAVGDEPAAPEGRLGDLRADEGRDVGVVELEAGHLRPVHRAVCSGQEAVRAVVVLHDRSDRALIRRAVGEHQLGFDPADQRAEQAVPDGAGRLVQESRLTRRPRATEQADRFRTDEVGHGEFVVRHSRPDRRRARLGGRSDDHPSPHLVEVEGDDRPSPREEPPQLRFGAVQDVEIRAVAVLHQSDGDLAAWRCPAACGAGARRADRGGEVGQETGGVEALPRGDQSHQAVAVIVGDGAFEAGVLKADLVEDGVEGGGEVGVRVAVAETCRIGVSRRRRRRVGGRGVAPRPEESSDEEAPQGAVWTQETHGERWWV